MESCLRSSLHGRACSGCWKKEERKDLGKAMVAGGWRRRRTDGRQVVNLPFTTVLHPMSANPDPGGRNSGSPFYRQRD